MTKARKKTSACPACGKAFLNGKRALVNGIMRRVCLSCSSGAVRVVCTVSQTKCTSARCNGTASVCVTCASSAVSEALAGPLGPIAKKLHAMYRALTKVAPKGEDAGEHLQGKIEGLETAIAVIEGRLSGE